MAFKQIECAFFVVFCFHIALIQCAYQEQECSDAGGQCQSSRHSCSGSYHTGLCPSQSSSIKCCVPSAPYQEDKCAAAGGMCKHKSDCTGTTLSGKCPTQAADVKCCVDSGSGQGTNNGGELTDDCISCICKKESGCKNAACKWDVTSDSCGYFQIKLDYYKDCGMPTKKSSESTDSAWRRCAREYSCAERCLRAYMKRYGKYCTGGSNPTCEDYARIHNGGPKGCQRSSTIGYWNPDVKNCCSAKQC